MQAARGTAVAAESSIPRRRRQISRLLFALVALGGLALDLATKTLAATHLDPERPVVLAGGLLRLQLIRNPGAAFSLGENVTIVFALLSLVVLAFVLIRLVPRVAHRGWAVALGLLVAGVSGNLTDRIFREPSFLHGHVVDFLELPHWPIFNVADMCITSAAVLIVVLAIIKSVGLDGVSHRAPRPGNAVQPTDPAADDRVEPSVGPEPTGSERAASSRPVGRSGSVESHPE